MTLHYPDRTERLFVVNAPRGISLVLGVATRFMPPWTRSRIVVSTDCAPLLAYVGAARLPLEVRWAGGDTAGCRRVWEEGAEGHGARAASSSRGPRAASIACLRGGVARAG
jgi:hypothetical protein